MKLSEQVCTLEQAKKIYALGVERRSLFYHFHGRIEHEAFGSEYYSAFTVAELGVMLPNAFDTMAISVSQNVRGWAAYDDNGNDVFKDEVNFSTEAEARAAMCIYLLEHGIITAEEINKRLTGA